MQKTGIKRECPSEDVEQQQVFTWAEWLSGKYSALKLMHHIPNGGKRSKSEAARFMTMGVKAGIPDIFLPTPRGGFHGLYVEMKKRFGGRVSDEQKDKLAALSAYGYATVVCCGAEEAQAAIMDYLRLEPTVVYLNNGAKKEERFIYR